MDFGGAIHCMWGGGMVYRAAWAKGIYIGLKAAEDSLDVDEPYFYRQSGSGSGISFVAWIPSYADMLADDWVKVPAA